MINNLLLKSLHSTLGITIVIYSATFEFQKEFRSEKNLPLYYNHHQILKNLKEQKTNFLFYNGPFNEIILAYSINNQFILFGPWRCNKINKEFFKLKMEKENIKVEEQEYFYNILNKLPFLSVGQLRELLVLINFCLTGNVVDSLSIPLHRYISEWSTQFNSLMMKSIIQDNYSDYIYLYKYENQILEMVKLGNLDFLKTNIQNLSNSITPCITGDTLRSEKNYSITVFDRLAQTTISLGLDIETAYASRDIFIRDTELCLSLTEVLKLRDTAIVFYTKKIGEVKNRLTSPESPIIIAIIQYLTNNLNKKINTSKIASYFHMSESKLRKIFKKETNTTINQYFLQLKINCAKELLQNGEKISVIADTLDFSSSANFSRAFKKIVGKSPQNYQQSLINNISLLTNTENK